MYKHPNLKSKYLYKGNIAFGVIASLHISEHSLHWNPHLHILICEDRYDPKNNKIKISAFMSYKKLRHTWRYQLLEYLDKKIDVTKSVEDFINKIVLHYPNENFKIIRYFGFYSNKSSKTYDKIAKLVDKKVKCRVQLKKERQAIVKINQKTEDVNVPTAVIEQCSRSSGF